MYKTKLSDKIVIAIFIALNLWICNVHAQNGNCRVPGAEISFLSKQIVPGQPLENPIEIDMEFTVGTVTDSYTEDPTNSEKYFTFFYDEENAKMIISTTDEFLNYERNQNKKELIATIMLLCQNNFQTEMVVTLEFEDVNNFKPEFTQTTYEIEIPLPLPIGIEIFSLISDRISAIDYDLYNNQITFTSDITDQPFMVSTSSVTGTMGKEYFVNIFTTAKIINIRNGIEFKIIATDSGTLEQKTADVVVKIMAQSDDEDLIEVPIFKSSLYIGTLDFQQIEPLKIETISLLGETFHPLIEFTMELNTDDYFHLHQENQDNAIEIRLNDGVTESSLNGLTQISFVVRGTRQDGLSGNTAVLINVIPKESLLFDNTLYTGTIKPDMTIDHDPIKLTDDTYLTDVEFSIKEDVLGWFEIIADPNVNQMQIKLIQPLSDTELEGLSIASLTILAKSAGDTVFEAEAYVILGIERADVIPPAFQNSFYEGIISSDLEITNLDELKLTEFSNIGEIEYTLSDYTNLFDVVKTDDGVRIIKINLAADDITDKNTLQFTVTATNDKGITGSTVVILTIEREELIVPVFQKQIYTGLLKKPISPDSLEINDDVVIHPQRGNIEFTLSGDDTKFIKIESHLVDGITLGLVDDLSLDDIADRTVLTVIVTAKLVDTSLTGSTVVLIHVEQEAITIIQPAFEKNFYYGSLSESYDLALVDDSRIKLKDDTFFDTIVFTKIGADAEYFNVHQTNTDNNVEIEFDTNTNLDELADKTTLSFSIVATLNGDYIITGTTTVVIELPIKVVPPEIIPTFEQYLYAGLLNTDLTLDLPTIRIEPATYTTGITFDLIGFDADFFVVQESTTNPGTIEITSDKITDDLLKTNQLFKFSVRAMIESNPVSITSLVIEVPRELLSEVVPQFEKPLYEADLSADLILSITDPIKLIDDSYSPEVIFTLASGFDSDIVKLTETGNLVTFELEGITAEDIKSRNVLKFVIIAKKSETIYGTTVVLINLPVTLPEDVIIPEFKASIYHGSLPAAMDQFDITVEITAETFTPGIEFILKDDDSALFEIVEVAGALAKIELRNPFDASNIEDQKVLSFTVEALSETGLKGTTTVIIDIPSPNAILQPVFVQSLYVGSLDNALQLSFDDEIMLTDDSYSDDVQFSLVDIFDSDIVKLTETGNLVTFELEGITAEDIKSRNVLKFVIIAKKSETIYGTTVVLINLPVKLPEDVIIPEFKASIYHGSLPAAMDQFDITVEITAETFTPGIEFILKDDDSALFEIVEVAGALAKIELRNPFDASNIEDQKVLSFTVEALSETGLKGTTTVIIDIPSPNAILQPVFVQSLYVGSLDNALQLSFDDEIMLTDDSYSDDVQFSLVDIFDSDIVKLTETGNLVTFELEGITTEDIKSRNVLKFVIIAKKSETIYGTTVVLINLPVTLPEDVIIPEFKESIYHASLPAAMDQFDITVEITAETFTPGITFILKDRDSALFEIVEVAGALAKIELRNPFDASNNEDQKVLSFTVEALSEIGLKGTATVIIDIPSPNAILQPVFVQSLYVGSLDNALQLSFDDEIMLTDDSYSDEVKFSLVDIFDSAIVKLTETGNLVTFELEGITAEDIKSRNVLKFVIIAKKSETIYGTTVVLINLPVTLPEDVIIPEFKESIYHASLPAAMDQFDITVEITAETFTPGITFILKDSDSAIFEIVEVAGALAKIELRNPFDSSNNEDQKVLSFTVEALSEIGLKGTSTVIIDIPSPNAILQPVFVQSLYVGSLDNALQLSFDDEIMLTDDSYSDEVKFSLVDIFDSAIVKLTETGNLVTFELEGITAEDIKSRNVLKFVIIAKKSETIYGTTVVLINLPVTLPEDVIIPEFKESIYHGSLPAAMDQFDITVEITAETFTPGITFILKDRDSALFEIVEVAGALAKIELRYPFDASNNEDKKVLSFTVEALSEIGLKGTSTVIIDIPSPNAILQPVFVQSLYVGSLDNALQLSFDDEIMLTDDSYSDDVHFSLVDIFDSDIVKLTETGNLVTFELEGITAEDIKSRNVLKFVIIAKKSETIYGTTVVLINLPVTLPEDVIIPEFKESIYHGSLPAAMDQFDITVEITAETFTPGITFILKDRDSALFEIVEVAGALAKIELRYPFDASNNEDKKVLSFTVEALSEIGLKGTSTVIIDIPSPNAILQPVFVQSLYVGSLDNALQLSFDDEIMLTDDSYSDDVHFSLVDIFDSDIVKLTETGNLVTFELEGITAEDIKSRNVLKFVIIAKKSETIYGTTVVLINLPVTLPEDVIIPEFKESIYHGSLPAAMDQFDITVEITAETFTPGITFILKDRDSALFEIVEVAGALAKIELRNPFDASNNEDKKVLSFTVEALSEIGLKGRSTVIIDIPSPNAILQPVFVQSLYVGSLDNALQLSFDDEIMLTDDSYSDEVKFSLVDIFDSDIVKLTETGNLVTFELEGITAEDIKSRNVLKFVIIAKKSETIYGTTVVLINLPVTLPEDVIIPEFKESIYHGSLPAAMDQFDITVEITAETFTPGITFILKDRDSALFEIVEVAGALAKIELRNPFDASNNEDQKLLSFTVEALSEIGLKGTSTVIIDIPSPNAILQPVFVQSLYVGSLDNALQLSFDDEIMLTDDSYSDDVHFSLVDIFDSDIVKLTETGNLVTFELEGITAEDIKSRNVLKFVIIAKKSETIYGTTVVLINLPVTLPEDVIIPEFKESIYHGSLPAAMDQFDITVEITAETFTPGITFILKDRDSALFEIVEVAGALAKIELRNPFDASNNEDKKVLSFTVEALSEIGLKGTSTVIIDIPSPNAILQPVFVQSLYVGSLDNALQLSFDDEIMLTDDSYSDEVKFSLVDIFDSAIVKLTETGNLVTFELEGITAEDIKSRNVLKFVIIAKKSETIYGTTVVLINLPVTLPEDVIIPEFKESIYHGSLPAAMDQFDITVEITAETFTPGITFILKDRDSALFEIVEVAGALAKIELRNPFDASNNEDQKLLSFTVEALSEIGLKGTSTVIIDIPSPNAILQPVFVQSLYVGSLDNALQLSFDDEIMLTDDSYSDDVHFSLVDIFDSDIVKLTETGNLVTFELEGITAEDIKSRNVLKFVIIAKKSETIYGTTVVLINLPVTLPEDVIIPEFKESIYHGSLPAAMDQFDITVEITAETFTPGITFILKDRDSALFEIVEVAGALAKIELRNPFDASNNEDKKVLSFTVEALSEIGLKGTSTVIIDIPSPNAILQPVFVQSLYVGSLDNALQLSFDDEIMLTDDSYSDDVHFSLVDIFDSDIVKLTETGNLVTFELEGITAEDIKSRNVLKFVIIAKKSETIYGTTVVLINLPVTLPEDVIIPEFKESIYHGSLPAAMDQFDITVEITAETFTPGIEFILKDDDSALFEIVEVTGALVKIGLRNTIDVSNIPDKKVLSFTVEALLEIGFKGTTTIIIDIPSPNAILQPVFVQSLYVGSLDNALQLSFDDEIMLTDDSYSGDVQFSLVDIYDHDLFKLVELGGKSISIEVKEDTDEVIKTKSILKVIISASNLKTNQIGFTVVVVEVKSTPAEEIVVPQFEQSLYVGILTTDLKIDIDPIKIVIETYSSNIDIRLDGADNELFTYDRIDNEINVKTVRDLTENDLENKQFLNLIISASLLTGEASSAVVIFEIPYEGCQIPNEDTKPKFENEYYTVTIEPTKVGSILTVYAEVPIDPTLKVIYESQIDNSELSSKIEMKRDTGELSVTDTVVPGIYNFIVRATNPNDNSIGYAPVKLTVTSVIYCSEEPTVSHSLIVKNLEEEIPHNDIFVATITDPNCQYEIVTVTPNSLTSLFEIKEQILISQSFDREDILFQTIYTTVPQIRLVLEIVCDNAAAMNGKYMSISYNKTRAIRSTKDNSDETYYVSTNDIVRDAKRTILSIVIKDINDNRPVFENPMNDILIGYPESQLAEKLLPPYLTKVYATDKDEGINAKIKYTIDPNPHFSINAETGVVYPLKNSMDDALEYSLVVNAIDQDGAGRATSLNIHVKRLKEENFIVISIENEILDNLDAILEKIETEVALKVNVLNAVIVSTATDENSLKRTKRSMTPFIDGEQTVLRIIGYAFTVDGDPIDNEELETKLSAVTTVSTISTQNLVQLIGDCDEDETVCPTDCNDNDDCDECDDIGLIVGIIVLAVLLLLVCIAIFVMWWRWIRPNRYMKRDSSNEQLERDFNDAGYTEPVVAPIATTSTTDHDIFGKSNFEMKNENAPTQTTSALPHSSPASLAKSLQSVLDMDNRKASLVLDKDNLSGSSETDDNVTPPLRERKKSIKFNETVERIDILDDITDKENTAL